VIAESADGRKDEVAWAKIYFAYTTERYELLAQNEEDALRFAAPGSCRRPADGRRLHAGRGA
jgi:hypothetical protein